MVLVRTNLNREYVVYPSGLDHPTDPHLLDLVHDAPCFDSSSHTPYVKIGFPTPSIEIGFLKGWIETRFTNHYVLTMRLSVTPHCAHIHDDTDHTNNQMDNHQANYSIA